MPIYEYRCRKCGEKFESFRGISQSDIEVVCPKCGVEGAVRIVSPFFSKNSCGSSGSFAFPT